MRAKLAEAKKRRLIISDRALRPTSATLPTTSAWRFSPLLGPRGIGPALNASQIHQAEAPIQCERKVPGDIELEDPTLQ
jgi:hypothetical protein